MNNTKVCAGLHIPWIAGTHNAWIHHNSKTTLVSCSSQKFHRVVLFCVFIFNCCLCPIGKIFPLFLSNEAMRSIILCSLVVIKINRPLEKYEGSHCRPNSKTICLVVTVFIPGQYFESLTLNKQSADEVRTHACCRSATTTTRAIRQRQHGTEQ